MRVDGQRVKVTNRGGYAVARLVGLDRGNHRVIITVFDRAGLGKQRGWQFRVGKPIRSV